MIETSTDRIEKEIVMRAPRGRVWKALTDAREFGRWFRADIQGDFVAGRPARGRITHPGYEHVAFEVEVERIEPERLFSFRWHPYAVDPKKEYSQEPTTLVVFELEEVADGTRLKVTESGFDRIPPERRAEAFRMNSGGWEGQVKNIARHVAESK